MTEDEVTETAELIGLVEGTVRELKEYIRENNLDDEQLQEILHAERNSKNRKTAVKFLEKRLGIYEESSNQEKDQENESEEDEVVEEDSIDRETLLQILGGTVDDVKEYVEDKDPSDAQLQEILHAEKMVKDRSTVEDFLQSYSKKKDLKKEIEEAKHDLEELREDLETIEQNLDEDIDISDIELNVDDEIEGEIADEEESEEEENKDTEKEDEEVEEEPDSDEEIGEDEESKEATLEEKKELSEDLGVDLSEEELEEISMEELKAIKNEKGRREELIDELKEEFDEEELRRASTSDLEKLKEGLETDKEDKEEEEKSVEEKNKEMRKEAQEDLEILMGAVKSKDKGKTDQKSQIDKLKQTKNQFKQNMAEKLPFMDTGEEEEEEDEGMKEEKLLELLEEYREMDDYEAAIKTAHIMKGYLEYSQGIDRELTYRELGEEIEPETDEMRKLLEFFDRMHKDQYTGNITENMDHVIDASETIVKG